jgi:hypothetical protein
VCFIVCFLVNLAITPVVHRYLGVVARLMTQRLGAVLILLLTGWLPVDAGLVGLGWLTMSVCVLWLVTVSYLAREYRGLCPRPASA